MRHGLLAWSGALVLVLLGAVSAAAADVPPGCTLEVQTQPDGSKQYVVTCPPGSGGSDSGGSDSGGGATCELTGLYDYCIGASACWANVPSALDPSTWPEETRPSPDAIYTYQSCTPDPDGTLTGWSWYTPDEMTVGEAARQAFGLLRAPAFDVGVNPPRQAVVGIGTWFWAGGAPVSEVTGSSALGVVAIAEPDRLEVDPGDGSGVLPCPWTTAPSDACSHTYARSSAGQPVAPTGLPGYQARMRLVYDVRFENNGVPLTLPGLPTSLESPWHEASVPVAEVQAVVTP